MFYSGIVQIANGGSPNQTFWFCKKCYLMENDMLKQLSCIALVLIVLVSGVFTATLQAETNPPIRRQKITLPKEEVKSKFLVRNYFGQCRATYVSATPTRVKIDIGRGDVIEVPMFYFGSPAVHYIMNRMAKLPQTVTDHQMEPGRRRLVHVDAAKLPLGKLNQWKNDGELKGAFHVMNFAPEVVDFKGRRGVKFSEASDKYANPNHESLAADFTVTNYLGYEKPFTFSAWVYHPDTKDRNIEAPPIMSWGALIGDQQTVINLCNSDIAGMSVLNGKGPLGREEWQHLTYSYTGGHDGLLSIYRNGELVSTHQYDVKVEHREVTDITATTATLQGDFFTKKKAGSVAAFWGEIDYFQWYQMRHYFWDGWMKLDGIKPGAFNIPIKDLKPATKYYYRFATQDLPSFHAGYEHMNSRRFAHGPGMFVTASEDGKTPGRVIPNPTRQHFFIGCNRGSRWFMESPGPTLFFHGVIGEISIYDYAMDAFEVRQELGIRNAFKPTPTQDAEIYDESVTLSWKPGCKGVASYRVWLGAEKAAVESGKAKSYTTTEPTLKIDEMVVGLTQYWRVAQLDKDGKELDAGQVWSFENTYGRPRSQRPGNGETIDANAVLWWEGDIWENFGARVYLAESKEELAKMVTAKKPRYEGLAHWLRWNYTTMDVLHPGKTFYWQVEHLFLDDEGNELRVVKGPVWNFHVRNYFKPEVDTIWGKPAFDHEGRMATGLKQSEERVGFPARTPPLTPSKLLRDDETRGFSRFLYKTRKLRDFQDSRRAGAKIGHWLNGANGQYGEGIWSMAYGGLSEQPGRSDSKLSGGNMIMHEFGHHLHASVDSLSPWFHTESRRIFAEHIDNNIGLAGYGASNLGEDMACGFHMMNRATQRDSTYNKNRPVYNLIRTFTGGDTYIDLNPRLNLKTDAKANLITWGNAGGLVDYIDKEGIYTYDFVTNTQGTFTPVGTPIATGQSGGVKAIKLDGKNALLWNERTKLALYDNRDFSAEFWVKNTGGQDGVIAALIGEDGQSFVWRWSDFPGAKQGVWQHLAYVYEGGGATGNEAGTLRIFVGEKEVAVTNRKFLLPHNAILSVGGLVEIHGKPVVRDGFVGEMGQIRIYSYDISPDQVEEHYREENPHYTRVLDEVAEKLYIDMDCRRYTDLPQHRHEPFHPKNLRKPWIRSWPNFGSLAGRMHNDVDTAMWSYAGSTPIMHKVDGASVPVFGGKDRMVAGFTPDAEMAAHPPRTLELWIKRDPGNLLHRDEQEVALEWGQFKVTGEMLEKAGVPTDRKWHHVAIVFPKPVGPLPPQLYNLKHYIKRSQRLLNPPKRGKKFKSAKTNPLKAQVAMLKELDKTAKPLDSYEADIFVDGKPAGRINGLLCPATFERLHFGGHYDVDFWNWKHYFTGAFSAVRVHKGALTAKQIQTNAANKPQDLPAPAPKLVFDINAATLPNGPLKQWTYSGSGGGTFVEGTPPKKKQPKVVEHNGLVAFQLGTADALQSTFTVPESIKAGPFTIIARTSRAVPSFGANIMRWNGKRFSVVGGVWEPNSNGTIFDFSTRPAPKVKGGSTHVQRAGLKVYITPRKRREYFIEPTKDEYNPNAYIGWIWKTHAITYDGSTLKYYVDGKLERDMAAKISAEAPKARHHEPANDDLFHLGEGREQHVEAYLNNVQIYGRTFSAAELEAATSIKLTPLPGKPLTDVNFSKLKPGSEVVRIRNRGTLGGSFVSPSEAATGQETADRRPKVKTENGIRAVVFDGKNEFLMSKKPAPRTLTDNEPFTFEAFIKPAPETRSGMLLGLSDKPHGFDFRRDGLNASHVSRTFRNRQRPGSGVKLPPNQWVHMVFVYEGRRKPSHVYINGQRVSWNYWSTHFLLSNHFMRIGQGFDGGIARLRLWRGVLSEKEIAAMAKKALSNVTPTPQPTPKP